MLDFLATVDPLSLPIWAIILWSISMYPIGILLPCGRCCSKCLTCETGELPDTVTVTFDGIPDKTRSYGYITLEFSSNFGSGASARVLSPGGNQFTDKGPIDEIAVVSGGSGYAQLGRVAPTITVSGGSGTGLTATPTLESTNDGFGVPSWHIGSVSVSGGRNYIGGESLTVSAAAGDTTVSAAVLTVQTAPRSEPALSASVSGSVIPGSTVSTALNFGTPQTWKVSDVTISGSTSGYTNGTPVTFSFGDGVVEQEAAVASIVTAGGQPTVAASASGGSGAVLSVTLAQTPITSSLDSGRWYVESVSVTSGGSGYSEGQAVDFTVTDGACESPASAVVNVARQNPNLTPYVYGFDDSPHVPTSGTGAVLTATMSETTSYDGLPAWEVTNISVVNGGSGYQVGEYFYYRELDEVSGSNPPYYQQQLDGWLIASVDENGAITGIGNDGYGNGLYYKSGSAIQSVTVTAGGRYYKDAGAISQIVFTNRGKYYYYTGIPTGVAVQNAGEYYREDASKAPYVADVTVTLSQSMPSDGSGAALSVDIDSNTSSQTFGQITAVNIDNGGDGYLAWTWDAACYGHWINGKSVVLQRSKADPCTFFHTLCGGWPQLTSPSGSYFQTWGADGSLRSAPTAPATGAVRSALYVQYRGHRTPPRAWISLRYPADGNEGQSDPLWTNGAFVVNADSPVTNCDNFGFTATNPDGVSVSVSPGGDYDKEFRNPTDNQSPSWPCSSCCQGDSLSPVEVTVDLEAGADFVPQQLEDEFSGTYVLSRGPSPQSWRFSKTLGDVAWGDLCHYTLSVEVAVIPGVCPSRDDWPACGNFGLCPGCDKCIKACQTVAYISIDERCDGGVGYNYLFDYGGITPASWLECGACDPTPTCAPKQTTFHFATLHGVPYYALAPFVYGEDFCSLTIN